MTTAREFTEQFNKAKALYEKELSDKEAMTTTPTTPDAVQMPPLPKPFSQGWIYTADQMHAYAQAYAAQCTAELEAKLAAANVALLEGARRCEALKRDCGLDPESPTAIQNGRYMSVSHFLRAALTPKALVDNFIRMAGITKDQAWQCASIVLQSLASTSTQPASAVVQEPAAEIVADENGYLTTQWAIHYIPNKGDRLYTKPTPGAVEPTAQPTDAQIAGIALANGFTLKQQPDGKMALNPYVFDFARALMAPPPVAGDVGEALRQAEHGLSLLVKFQSSGKSPSIHDYGVARRALDVVAAAIAAGGSQNG